MTSTSPLASWLDHVPSTPGAPDGAPSRADEIAVKMYCARPRWWTTVALQGFIGLFFAFLPDATISILEVKPTVEMGILFRLYGALLLFRAIMEQYMRIGRDPRWIRAYMVSTMPFGIGSAIILGWASAAGYMNAIIGWVWVALFIAEVAEYLFALGIHAVERRRAVRA